MDKEFLAKKKDLLNGIAINQTAIGTQCKNLLNHTLKTQEIDGITLTVNKDKSIVINGEATSDIKISLGTFKKNKESNLILSGCPEGGSQSSYYLELSWTNLVYDDDNLIPEAVFCDGRDIGTGYTYIRKQNDSINFNVSLRIYKGTIMSNHIFKPMVRYADIMDDTYESYKPSLQEQITAIEKNIGDIQTILSTLTTVS